MAPESKTLDVDPAAIDAPVYNAFVQGLNIQGVDTVSVRGERLTASIPETIDVELGIGFLEDSGLLRLRYDANVRLADTSRDVVAEIVVSIVLTAESTCPEAPDGNAIGYFANTSGHMIVQPYLREAVAAIGTRLGLPGVLLPITTSQPATL